MKFLFICLLSAIAVANISCEDVYKSKFDNIDFDTITKNERLLHNTLTCLLGSKNCTPAVDELRRQLPELMKTCCAVCTEKYKEGSKKLVLYLMENEPTLLKKLVDKYDPDRKYILKCAEEFGLSGIDSDKL